MQNKKLIILIPFLIFNVINGNEKSPGEYEIEFNGSGLSSGIYFYTLRSGNFTQTNKVILLK